MGDIVAGCIQCTLQSRRNVGIEKKSHALGSGDNAMIKICSGVFEGRVDAFAR
jgi:hypothetical protein